MDHTAKYGNVELSQSFSTKYIKRANAIKFEDLWSTLHFLLNWLTLTLRTGRLVRLGSAKESTGCAKRWTVPTGKVGERAAPVSCDL